MAIKFGGKTFKNINEMSTRERSRFAQNERRKIDRRMARAISEEFGEKVSWKEAAQLVESGQYTSERLTQLSKQREFTVAQKVGNVTKGYDKNLQYVSENIASYTNIIYGSETLSGKSGDITQDRKNKLFERQINQSTKKEGFSQLEKDVTKAFYAGTQDLWKGKSTANKYNETIMEAFGVSDLESVYKLLTDKELKKEDFGFTNEEDFEAWLQDLDSRVNLSKRREVIIQELENIQGARKNGGTTDDSEYNSGNEEQEAISSPEYVNKIISRIASALNG